MMKINHKHIALLVMVSAITLTRCTDDFKEVAAPSGATITAVAADDSNLDIFSAGLVKTGLAVTLDNNNAGSFTAFAPTDDAFVAYFKTALGKGDPYTEDSVLTFINTKMSSTSAVKLSDFSARLTYHLVSSTINSDDLTGNQVFTTLNSARLSVSKNPDVLLNASAKVTGVDAPASNGVIHTIDKVLSPFGTSAPSAPTPKNTFSVLTYLGMTISYGTNPATIGGGLEAGADADDSDFDLFGYAIRKGEVAALLQPNISPVPDITLFVPTDKFFRAHYGYATEADGIAAIKAMSKEDVANLVKHHIVAGRKLSTDLTNNQNLTTLLTGAAITVVIDGATGVEDSDDIGVVQTKDILTNGGVLHTIDNVLVP
jgi:uncharacterized surface protein with fasciclin (FAS1) repeats